MRSSSWKVPAAFACGIVVGASLLYAPWLKAAPVRQQDDKDTLTLRKLIIADEQGKPIIVLSAEKSGAGVLVSDRTGQPRAGMYVRGKTSSVLLNDEKSKSTVLMIAEKGETNLSLVDGKATKTIRP